MQNAEVTSIARRSWIEFQSTSSAGSDATQLSKSHSEKVAANRTYAKQIINNLFYLGKQGLSLRGHNETTSSSNRGNFLELCDWYAKRDKVFCQLYNSPRNLTSPSIHNKLIEIAAFQVQNEILKRIIENGVYTILVDGARSFKQEQICVRFVNALDLNVEERFVEFVNCSKKADAVAIYTHIKFFLQKCGICKVPIVAQGYDGAADMSGSENGVQSKIRKDHPSAVYIHCMSHKLNLVLVEACKVNRMVNSFFLTLKTIYCFFAQPMDHEAFKEAQRSLGVKSEIGMISDTRWACRYKNVASLKKSFLPWLKVLTELSQPTNRKFIEAAGLLKVLKSARFCICLIIFNDVLRTIHVVHKSLQASDITLFSAKTCVKNMIHVF